MHTTKHSLGSVPIISMALFFVVWEGMTTLFTVPRFLLPAPHEIILRLSTELLHITIWQHMWATFSVAFLGMLLALIIGTGFGWLSYHSQIFYRATGWMIVGTQAIPVIAVAPLLFLWIQNEYWSRVMVTVVITFFPLYAATYTALQRVPRELREVASLEGYSRLDGFTAYEAALALPIIFAGVRSSMILATTGAVVGEYMGGRYGLGALINVARGLFDTTLMFVAVLILIVLTMVFAQLFLWIESAVIRSVE